MLPEELAWLAGLFEGEGCIYLLTKGEAWSWYLKISMTDLDILERVYKIVECGSIRIDSAPKNLKWKQSYTWEVGKRKDVLRLLKLLAPLLGERRRKKANQALTQLKIWEQTTIENWVHDSLCYNNTETESCSTGRLKKGLCDKHYQRMRRYNLKYQFNSYEK